MLRLNKYLSEAGVCSRREADRLIEQGRVKVDGTPATVGMHQYYRVFAVSQADHLYGKT